MAAKSKAKKQGTTYKELHTLGYKPGRMCAVEACARLLSSMPTATGYCISGIFRTCRFLPRRVIGSTQG